MIGYMKMPAGFRYMDVYLKGRPQHDKYDSFSIRHPAMDVTHRAKIFNPFDALKGFNEALEAAEASVKDPVTHLPEEQL